MNQDKPHYQTIPRKYRPRIFADVVGQEAAVTTLKNALQMNRLANAYLFCGTRGTGKTTLARLFAKALNCQKLTKDAEPCNECPSCKEVALGKSLDVLEIDGASSRGIDDIRQINETVGYAPSSGKYKIYIIDEVHMLTKEAFNALLKTLEEPPANVKFFFATTEPHKVLPTIVSRCQRFDLCRIAPDLMQQKLTSISKDLNAKIEPDALLLIAEMSDGSLRDGEALLDQILCYANGPITTEQVAQALGRMPKHAFFALDKAIFAQDLSFAFKLSEEIFSSGKDIGCFLDGLLDHLRTILGYKLQMHSTLSAKEHEQYTASSSLYSEEQLLYLLDFLIHWIQQTGKTPFKRITLEMILLHLVRSKTRVSVPSLVKRLIDLEKDLREKEPLAPISQVATPPHIIEEQRTLAAAILDSKTLISEIPQVVKITEAPAVLEKTAPTQPVEEKIQAPALEKIEVAPVEVKAQEKIESPQEKKTMSPRELAKMESLMRFAAIELEGTIKDK